MKVILKQDVKSLGKSGEIVEVSNGYARNFLLPKGLGVEVTSKNMNDLKLMQENAQKVAAENLAKAQALGEELGKASVSISMKFGENGKAFGSVTNKEIAQAIKEQLNLDIDKRKIQLADAIKEAGEHDVAIKLHKDVTASIKVVLTSED